jgi:hypothetical protein
LKDFDASAMSLTCYFITIKITLNKISCLSIRTVSNSFYSDIHIYSYLNIFSHKIKYVYVSPTLQIKGIWCVTMFDIHWFTRH